MLLWHDRLWLIDHGAALYLQHGGLDPAGPRRSGPFPLIAEHVLLAAPARSPRRDARLRARVAARRRRGGGRAGARELVRRRRPAGCYVEYLTRRLAGGGFVRGGRACPCRTRRPLQLRDPAGRPERRARRAHQRRRRPVLPPAGFPRRPLGARRCAAGARWRRTRGRRRARQHLRRSCGSLRAARTPARSRRCRSERFGWLAAPRRARSCSRPRSTPACAGIRGDARRAVRAVGPQRRPPRRRPSRRGS